MADERPQSFKERKPGLRGRLKDLFGHGSKSTPSTRSTTPHPPGASHEDHGGDTTSLQQEALSAVARLMHPGLPLAASTSTAISLAQHAPPTDSQLSERSGAPFGAPGEQGQVGSSAPLGSTTISSATQAHVASKLEETAVDPSSAAASPTPSTGKDALKVTLNFTQTLMKRAAEIVDGNPVKMALSLAKVIIQIKDAVKDNIDAVERRIASTGAQLEIVEKALRDPKTYDEEANQWMKQFKATLDFELKQLRRLSEEWLIRKVADHEKEKGEIAAIFERVNEARILFELGTGIAVFKIVSAIENDLRRSLGKDLEVSRIADHKYYLSESEQAKLRREVCTPGTRASILTKIVKWANDPSPDGPRVYWLFGPAGSGKSSIAYTIARRFELTSDVNDTIILGGNFFCSRQFDETRSVTHIVRTLVYHLALRWKTFADCLHRLGTYDAIYEGPRAQLDDLLVRPWVEAQSYLIEDSSTASPRSHLIIIDALDEVGRHGGSEFLRALLEVINDHPLPGLKFFVTSRPDVDLVARIESFAHKETFRLQDVEKEEVQADILK